MRQDDLTVLTLLLPEDLAYCDSNSSCCEVSGRESILMWWEWKVPRSEGTRPLRSYQCALWRSTQCSANTARLESWPFSGLAKPGHPGCRALTNEQRDAGEA